MYLDNSTVIIPLNIEDQCKAVVVSSLEILTLLIFATEWQLGRKIISLSTLFNSHLHLSLVHTCYLLPLSAEKFANSVRRFYVCCRMTTFSPPFWRAEFVVENFHSFIPSAYYLPRLFQGRLWICNRSCTK